MGSKRPGSPISIGGKQQVLEVSSTTAGPDEAMNLPGTGGGAGAATAEGVMVSYAKPHDEFQNRTATFKKVHLMYSFGIGQALLESARAEPKEDQLFLTTSMAGIPWEYPFFYMTPGQFAMLGSNTKCDKVRVTVRHIVTRQAFETASESTGLATLNQLSFIKTAKGLNQSSWGLDRHLGGYNSGDKMTPSTQTQQVISKYEELFWGVDNTDWTPSKLLAGGASLTGRWIELQNYFCLSTSKQQSGGIPFIRSLIDYKNGHTTKDQEIINEEYIPSMGYLKTPHRHNRWGLPQFIGGTTLSIATNQNFNYTSNINVGATGADNNTMGTRGSSNTVQSDNMSQYFLYDAPLEKSQYLKHAAWGADKTARVQPSLHIGVDPVPSITATDGPDIPVKYVDTLGYYEITAEMFTSQSIDNPFSQYNKGTVPFGETVCYYDNKPSINACTIGGLLPQQEIR